MFSKKVRNILIRTGWQGVLTPIELLDAWRLFVNECFIGYEMNIYEYDNDLSVRNAIEKIISENGIDNYKGFDDFKESVLSIDNDFKDLLFKDFKREEKLSWWEKGILRNAGEEYVRDIKDNYQINVRLI